MLHFQILTSKNGTALALFSPGMIDPETVRALVEATAQRVQGSQCVHADFTALNRQSEAQGEYVFGTTAILRFVGPQSEDKLKEARLIMAEVVAGAGHELVALTGSEPWDLIGAPA